LSSVKFMHLLLLMLIDSIEVACWMHTGERQAAKMRMAYLRSMLNQDISLFDTEASTGEVISSITTDIIVVQDALSEKVFFYFHLQLSSLFYIIFVCIFILLHNGKFLESVRAALVVSSNCHR